MIRTSIGLTRLRALTVTAVTIALLAGCENGAGFLQPARPDAADSATPADPGPLEERDIEAPDVFQVSEAALWDGRPSLGGIWVAHPDVTEPQRVIVRNMSNGKSTVGALFRRERDNPGPRIQASSDAAEALAMLAGAPVQLEVTALVRAPVEADPAPAQDATDPQADSDATATAAASESAAATESAAPEATDTGEDTDTQPPARSGFRWPWQRRAAAGAAATAAVVADGTGAAAPSPVETEPLAPASSLNKPYVQIGTFSLEANADRTASQLRAAGMTPTVRELDTGGTTLWRVLVGPASNPSEQSALLSKARQSGFPDAFTVPN